MQINLGPDDMEKARGAGNIRVQGNLNRTGHPMPNNCPLDDAWDYAAEGAMGEMAVAKLLGLEWSIGTRGGLDVGEYDVRQTKYHDGHLLLQPWDKARVNILVTGKEGKYQAVGYLYNPYGMIPKYWRGDIKRPCFWIPQKDLVPFTTMEDLEKYRVTETTKHQCAVRQMLKWHFEGKKEAIAEFVSKRGKDDPIYIHFIEQGKKGNKGDDGVWL